MQSTEVSYGGKLLRKKNMIFAEKTLHVLLTFAAPKDATSQISQRKLLRIATKPQNSRKFSYLKVSRYTVPKRHDCP